MSTSSFMDDPLAIFSAPAPSPAAASPQAAPPAPVPPPQPTAPPPPAPAPATTPPQAFTSLDQLAQGGQAPSVVTRPMGQNASLMSLDSDEKVSSVEFEYFKGRMNFVERIGILAPTKIVSGRCHYVEKPDDKKGQYYCNSVFERRGLQEVCTQVAPCCERLDTPRFRFSALVIHYVTQMNGAIADPFQFKLKVWRFTDRMFSDLQATNREWKLSEHDLLIKCEDEKYQRLKYDVTRECIYRRPDFLQKYGQMVAAWATQMLPKLEKTVGRRLTPAEWMTLLTGQTQGVANVVDAPVQDIGDVLSRGL